MSISAMISVGTFGLISNVWAMFVIYRSPLLHNTFGFLCFSHLVANFGMLTCFITWPVSMIYLQDDNLVYSHTSKRFGQITIVFWWSGLLAHVAISINRLCSIVYPLKTINWFTPKNTKFAVTFIWITAFLVTVPYFWDRGCYIVFNPHTIQWTYSDAPCGQFLSLFDFIGGVILCSFVFTVDLITLIRLRMANNIITNNKQTTAEMTKRRKNEIRLFAQAFSQCIVFCLTLLSFHIFTQLSDNIWWQFAMVTMVWMTAHSLDGFILVLFHFRLSLCSSKPKPISLATLSSRFTTIHHNCPRMF